MQKILFEEVPTVHWRCEKKCAEFKELKEINDLEEEEKYNQEMEK